jgi:hypothetical protein
MATSDKEQQSELVPQHKRMAQGAPINGSSMSSKKSEKKSGGLSGATKKK